MKNIFNSLDANAPSHMNAFDLSQRHIFSLPVGLKSVVTAIDTMPKDYFEMDMLSLVRSMPINTAAFARMKVQFDAVFVPYQQLWHGWNQFYLQTEENMSVGSSFDHSTLPSTHQQTVLQTIYSLMLPFAIQDACKLISGNTGVTIDFIPDTPQKLLLSLTNHSQIWSSIFQSFYVPMYFDNVKQYLLDEQGFPRFANILRCLDMLGYGSYYLYYQNCVFLFAWLIRRQFISGNKSFFEVINWVSSRQPEQEDYFAFVKFLSLDDVEYGNLYDTFDIMRDDLNDFGIPINVSWEDFVEGNFFAYYRDEDMAYIKSNEWNIFRALAYQKAYQDYTLNKRIESYDATYFNVDNTSSIIDFEDIVKIFTLRYDVWPYDLFTGVFNSPQTGDVSMISGPVTLSVNGNNNPLVTLPYGQGFSSVGYHQTPGEVLGDQLDTRIVGPSVYDVKRAEYLQRWKENHLRAGNKLKNQALGQWGTHFRYMSDEYSDFITSWEMPINIDEVINTADNQGDISGKGIGTSDGHFTFRANDAGVILIMVSVVPRAEYDSLMIDKQNTCLEYGDFPSPFFDNLGLESVPQYLLNNNRFVDNQQPLPSLGFTVRYAPWKTAVDKVHGEFQALSAGVFNQAGQFSIWSAPRRDLEMSDPKDVSKFYISPSIVDTLFGSSYNGKQETDHFIFNTNLICKVVRNLSVSGQIAWNV